MKKLLKRMQNKDLETETTIWERFTAGATAGFISQTIVYPLDVIILDDRCYRLIFFREF